MNIIKKYIKISIIPLVVGVLGLIVNNSLNIFLVAYVLMKYKYFSYTYITLYEGLYVKCVCVL